MDRNNEYANLILLAPKVRDLAQKLMKECEAQGFSITIPRGFRTEEQQNEYYEQGRTKPGKIITMVKGGFSFHNYGVAFDIRPVVKEGEEQKKEELYRKAGKIGVVLGFEWGGAWTEFEDLPHFQYTAGYSIEDFRYNRVDWSKFDI